LHGVDESDSDIRRWAGGEEIGEEAFKDCTSMEEIVIPNAVRAIKEAAFRMGLTRATLGDGLEEIEIGEMAFGYCSSMEEIVIPSAVREDTRHLI
jgi:hypothetical protein